jgi:2,4-dienoyl-CoA reductase-like NADH-dependent reductase (Old Yellow Enzyme family)
VQFAREIREKVNIPVIGVGLVTEAQQAEEALQNGDADLIAIAAPCSTIRTGHGMPRQPWALR